MLLEALGLLSLKTKCGRWLILIEVSCHNAGLYEASSSGREISGLSSVESCVLLLADVESRLLSWLIESIRC